MRIEDMLGVAVLGQHVAHAYSKVDEHLPVEQHATVAPFSCCAWFPSGGSCAEESHTKVSIGGLDVLTGDRFKAFFFACNSAKWL